MMIWIKGFIRGLYAIPIFLFRVFMSSALISCGAFIVLGEWAYGRKSSYLGLRQEVLELWGVKK